MGWEQVNRDLERYYFLKCKCLNCGHKWEQPIPKKKEAIVDHTGCFYLKEGEVREYIPCPVCEVQNKIVKDI